MQLRNSIRIAGHETEITGKLVRVVLHGNFNEQDARAYADVIDAAIPRGAPYVVFADVSGLKDIAPAARRYFTAWHKEHRCERCAVVGATLIVRGFVSLIVRAMSLTGGFSINLRFFTEEAEAGAWIQEWQNSQPDRPA